MMNFLFALFVLAAVIGSQIGILLVTRSKFELSQFMASVVAPLTEEVGRLICPLVGVLLGGFELVGYGTTYTLQAYKTNNYSKPVAVVLGVFGGLKHLALHLAFTGVLLGLGGGFAGFSACVALHAANNTLAVLNIQPPLWLRMTITPIRLMVTASSTLMFIAILILGPYLYF